MACSPAKGVTCIYTLLIWYSIILRSVDATGLVKYSCSVVGRRCFANKFTSPSYPEIRCGNESGDVLCGSILSFVLICNFACEEYVRNTCKRKG